MDGEPFPKKNRKGFAMCPGVAGYRSFFSACLQLYDNTNGKEAMPCSIFHSTAVVNCRRKREKITTTSEKKTRSFLQFFGRHSNGKKAWDFLFDFSRVSKRPADYRPSPCRVRYFIYLDGEKKREDVVFNYFGRRLGRPNVAPNGWCAGVVVVVFRVY